MENKNVAAFVKVVEYNSFTKAAESLGYSQAAVTAQIKALEHELEVPLFDRIGKRICLTQAGRTFLPHALNMLKAEEEAVHSVRPASELSGELRLCSASSYASAVLPDLLLKFLRLHPGVRITVKVSDYPEDTTRMLARGEIDFLAEVGDEFAYPDFLQAGKRPEPMVFVTYPGNPLLKKKDITVADVVSHRFVTADIDIAGYSILLEKQLQQRGLAIDCRRCHQRAAGRLRLFLYPQICRRQISGQRRAVRDTGAGSAGQRVFLFSVQPGSLAQSGHAGVHSRSGRGQRRIITCIFRVQAVKKGPSPGDGPHFFHIMSSR